MASRERGRPARTWDDGFPGARASRPHQARHSLGHLPHLDQPGTAPWLSFGLADAVPADRVAACSIALKLSAGQRNSMRAGRPRSQVIRDRMRAGRPRSQEMPSRRWGGGVWRATSQKADVRPLGNSRLPELAQGTLLNNRNSGTADPSYSSNSTTSPIPRYKPRVRYSASRWRLAPPRSPGETPGPGPARSGRRTRAAPGDLCAAGGAAT